MNSGFLQNGQEVQVGKRYVLHMKRQTPKRVTLMELEEHDRHGWLGRWRFYRERNWWMITPLDIDKVVAGWDSYVEGEDV